MSGDVIGALRVYGPATIFTLTRYIDRCPTSIRWCLERLRRYGVVGSDKSVRPQRWYVVEGARMPRRRRRDRLSA
jgi:hypothetical protein